MINYILYIHPVDRVGFVTHMIPGRIMVSNGGNNISGLRKSVWDHKCNYGLVASFLSFYKIVELLYINKFNNACFALLDFIGILDALCIKTKTGTHHTR